MKLYVMSGEVQEIVIADSFEQGAQKGIQKALARNSEVIVSRMVSVTEKGFANRQTNEGMMFFISEIIEEVENLNIGPGALPFIR